MIHLKINSNIDKLLKSVRNQSAQLPVIVRKAVNDGVREAEKAMIAKMSEEFDRPTPFTKRATLTRFGNQQRGPTAEITIKDEQAAYLGIHSRGGVDKPKRKVHAVGVSVRRDRYGNPNRTERALLYKKANQKGGVYFIASGKTKRDKHLVPGLYGRGIKEIKKDSSIKSTPVLLYYHIKQRKYPKRWFPEKTFQSVAIKVFEQSLQRRMREAGLL